MGVVPNGAGEHPSCCTSVKFIVRANSPFKVGAGQDGGYLHRVHEGFWAAARRTDGGATGTRALIELLLLHRSMTSADVIAGLTAALQVVGGLGRAVREAPRSLDANPSPTL